MNKRQRRRLQMASKKLRRFGNKNLKLETLEARQLLAANVLNDAFETNGAAAFNVLSNDTSGNEVQTVSSFQMNFDPTTVDETAGTTDWFVPERPGQTGVPQRSLISGAVFGAFGGFGNVSLLRDTDNDPSNDGSLTVQANSLDSSEGVVLPTLRDNTPVDGTGTNLGALSYRTDNGGPAEIWSAAAPENSGRNTVPFSGAFFPYSEGWVGGSWDSYLNVNAGGNGITVSGRGGRYEASVEGVTDSSNDGFLFAVGAHGSNDDNYARTRPIEDGKWAIQVRDNAAELTSDEGTLLDDDFNLLYIPRNAQGLIGGIVDGSVDGTGGIRDYATGNFEIQRQSDGFWRVSIPGQSVTSGVIIAESNDPSVPLPVNAYYSYDDAGDGTGDIIIRQFAWNGNTETPLNTDFTFFFVPFDNTISTVHELSVVPGSLGSTTGTVGVSDGGVALSLNADNTVYFDIRQFVAGESGTDSFVYKATDGTTESTEATVTITWQGANDAPEVLSQPADRVFSEGDGASSIDLTAVFADVDNGDSLTYAIESFYGSPVSTEISGTNALITPIPGKSGTTTITITATDASGATTSVQFRAGVFSVADDVFQAQGGLTVNVLANDTTGSETPNVSAFQATFDPASVSGNTTSWSVPERPDQAGIPQRSMFPGAVFTRGGNTGDIDLIRDIDADPTNDSLLSTGGNRLFNSDGVVLPVMRDNSAVDSTNTNLGVLKYKTDVGSNGDRNTWIAISAAPENSGENNVNFGAAFFPYSAGWVGGSWNANLEVNSGGEGITVTGGGGRYEAQIDGVSDSYESGFLFGVSAQNGDDNYTRTRPIDGGKWAVQVRDNAAELNGAEGSGVADDFNLLYVPRDAQGLIGGVVDASVEGPGAMSYATGNFSLQRESDGFWRLSVPGQDITSGVIITETYDLSETEPRNAYFSYDDAADGSGDILIRQFAWNSNSETPLNTDFVFFFVPFENNVNAGNGLTISRLDATSQDGVAVTENADGSVTYGYDQAQYAALPEGTVVTDTFTYDATDGVRTDTATVTVTLAGVNDAPVQSAPIGDIILDEGGAAVAIDLANFFSDVDTGDAITFSVDSQLNPSFSASLSGSVVTVTPAEDLFGTTTGLRITARDNFGGSVTVDIPVAVFPVDDDALVAVGDSGIITDKVTPTTIDATANDFQIDTTEYSVASAEIFGDTAAVSNGDANAIWTVVRSTAAPNDLTIQSSGNVGDVAVGRGGQDLFPVDGVMIGTVRENASPYSTIESSTALGSHGFATGVGIGGGERSAPISAAFFPFAEGWTSGHIAADGTLLGGVGISQTHVKQIQPGLFEITIPEASSPFDGMLYAIGTTNDDNLVSVLPGFDNRWLVRQLDSDDDATGFKNASISFVYIPGSTAGLIGGVIQSQEGSFFPNQQYGDFFVGTDTDGAPLISITGYTPADGALIAVSTGTAFADVNGSLTNVPANHAVLATPQSNDFRIDILQSGTYGTPSEAADFQFIFLPYDSPLERVTGIGFDVTSFDATSQRGAAVSFDNGAFTYDPTTADASIQGLGNGQSVEDTFTYTIQDGRGSTATATVTVTVQGENQAPTAVDDVVNLNELSADGVRLTVLGNDVDPDIEALLGTPGGIPAANLSVDGSSVWSVSQTGTGSHTITLVGGTTGDVEVLQNGTAIDASKGVVLATIRENFDGANSNYRLVQAYPNGSGGTSLALQQFGTDAAADANVAVAYFPFADRWIGGHVDATGALTGGNGLTATEVLRTDVGRYQVSIPGVSDASQDGYLFVIGNENADNVVSARAVPGTSDFEVAVRDNTHDFGDGEDGGFSFVFVPRNAQDLVAGTIDPFSDLPNAVSRSIGEFSVERIDVAGGGWEWKVTIPGQSPDTGMLLLTNQDDNELEDNFLSYGSDGSGSFLIRNHDMPGLGRQNQPFSFAFLPFDSADQPAARPVPGLLAVDSVVSPTTLGSTVAINPDGTITYTPSAAIELLYTGESATDTFTYTMTDGFGGFSTASVTLQINGFGDAPRIVTSPGRSYFGVGDEAVGIDGLLDVVPIGTLFTDGAVASFELTAGQVPTDQLEIRNEGSGPEQVGVSGSDVSFGGTVVGSYVPGSGTSPLTITFNANADELAVNRVMKAVTFSTAESSITRGLRRATISFTDGNGVASDNATKEIEIGLVHHRSLQQGVDFGYGTYTGVSDAQIREATPTVVSAPEGDLLVDFDASGVASQVLLRFDDLFGTGPGQIPPDAIITSANLVVTTDNTGDGGRFFRLSIPWDESAATWDSFGGGIQVGSGEARGVAESQIGTAAGGGATGTGEHFVSVLPDIRAWAAGETNHGWVIDGWTSRTDGWAFRSSENGNPLTGPRLDIEWVPAGSQIASFRQGVNGYSGVSDTVLSSVNPDVDNSATESLFVDFDNDQGRVLIRFDDIIGNSVGQIPAGAQVVSARLRTASIENNSQGDGAGFYSMLIPWSDTDTHNSLVDGVSSDGVQALAERTTAAGNPNRDPNAQAGFQDWDVTADVQAWVSGARNNYGWLLEPWDNGTDGWGITSSESAVEAHRPQLEVVFTMALESEINVIGSHGQELVDGELFVSPLSGTDFGSAEVDGGTVVKSFTIENTGTAALNISSSSISGDEASAFSFGIAPVVTIIPGASISFDVTFDPTKQGIHDATIEIISDDTDEGVFTFALQGNGTAFQSLSATPDGTTQFAPIGGIDTGLSGAEISAFHPATNRLFVTSGAGLQVVDLSDPTSPVLLSTITPITDGASDNAITSVAVNAAGIVAAAVPGIDPQSPGHVFFYDAADATFLGSVAVGALPDMVAFTPDGSRLLVANEGEPSSSAIPAMATGENGYQVQPVFTVGETFTATTGALNASTAGDYTPPGVLDGLGAYELDAATVRVFANHELLNTRGYDYSVSNGSGGTFTLSGSRISYFDIDKDTRQVVDAGIAYDTIYDADGNVATDASFLANNFAGFSRFCSSVLIEPHQFGSGIGLEDRIYFSGEEDGGVFNGVGGAEWALDPTTGSLWQISAMGRGAWENITEIDTGTTTHVAFLLSDDSSPFDFDPAAADGDEAAPLFLYVGQKNPSGDFLARNGLRDGALYVWVSDGGETTPSSFNGLGGTPTSLSGSWVPIENGTTTGGTPNTPSEDGSSGFDEYGYPTQGTLWLRAKAVSAFGFSRPEDLAVNPTQGNQAVLASTGVDTYENGVDTFGTLYTITTNFTNLAAPTASIEILYDGDADLSRALRSPDNLDWADDGFIYVQEDKAETETLLGEPLFGSGAVNPKEAGIVRLDPATGDIVRVATIDRSVILDPTTGSTPFDTDAGVAGAWESSGIVDVSTLFGETPGSLFLFDVQAHGIEDQATVNSDSRINDFDLVEGGQLALLTTNATPAADPVGSISIVDLSTGVATATVQSAGFEAFDGNEDVLRAAGVKLTHGKSVSQDVEPEYITVTPDGTTAVVTLQENNAVAVVDIASGTVVDLIPLGYKDHSAANAQIDPTNNSPDALTLGSFPVRGLFQPDAIANYIVGGEVYFITANEGDARGAEETDIQSVTLDPTLFPGAATLQDPGSAGELEITNLFGDADGDGDFDALYAFGGRSFSIWNQTGDLVFDSGDLLARATAALGLYPDGRSDNKGTEPEGVVIGQIDGQTYAFIGMERANATAVFNVSDPTAVVLTQILADTADISPEGLAFISATDSPNGAPLLVVSNEVSNTLRVYSMGASVIPEVQDIVINDGGNSRSQITSITVHFNTEVDHIALQSAFTITNIDDSTQVGNVIVNASNGGGTTTVVLTFGAGASVIDRAGTGLLANSLANGNYRLDITAAQVISSGKQMAVDYLFGGQNASATPNDNFFRLYLDGDGDGDADLDDLRLGVIPALNTSAGDAAYNPMLDGDGDQDIDLDDIRLHIIPNLNTSRL